MRPANMVWQPPRFEVVELAAKRSRYCLVVTVWNEGERFRRQLERMEPYAGTVDVVVADWRSLDGSTDPDLLRRHRVRTLLQTDEGGLGTAVRLGLAYAIDEGYDGVVTVDGNGKDGVDAIPRFVDHLEHGWDFVQGSRFLPGGEHANTPLERQVGIRLLVAPLLSLAAGRYITDPTNGFRAMSRRYLTDPSIQPIRAVFVRFNLQLYLVSKAARFRFVEIPVVRIYPEGESVPTKIADFETKMLFVRELLATLRGKYDP